MNVHEKEWELRYILTGFLSDKTSIDSYTEKSDDQCGFYFYYFVRNAY